MCCEMYRVCKCVFLSFFTFCSFFSFISLSGFVIVSFLYFFFLCAIFSSFHSAGEVFNISIVKDRMHLQ